MLRANRLRAIPESLCSKNVLLSYMAIGAGVDFKVSRRFSIRLLQVNYLMTRFNELGLGAQSQNNLRVSSGVVSASNRSNCASRRHSTSVARCRQKGLMRQASARCTFGPAAFASTASFERLNFIAPIIATCKSR